MAVSDEDKNKAWKSCHEKFLSTEFAWDWSGLSQADKNSNAPRLTDKDVIRKTISKMMNGRAAGSSDVVSDIVRKAGADMITDLVNQII